MTMNIGGGDGCQGCGFRGGDGCQGCGLRGGDGNNSTCGC